MSIYGDIKKENYNLIERQKKNKEVILKGYPYWLTVDPTNICNLECRFCPTGQKRGARPQKVMDINLYKAIMDKIGKYLLYVEFCNWGEPLLNKNMARMIKIAKEYEAHTFLSTNLNVNLTENLAEELVKSGLDRMTISIDGASQKTYEIYRKNGNIDLVFKNIKLLVDAKNKLNSKTPHLHWQFLVFKHNEHEIETARQMSKTIGVNDIGFTAPFCDVSWASTINEYNNYIVKEEPNKKVKEVIFKNADKQLCNWLWDAITINADGSISPCCSVEDKKDDFEEFDCNKDFSEIWNSSNYVQARKHVLNRIKPDFENVCTKCNHIGASNHRDIYFNNNIISKKEKISYKSENLVELNRDLNFREYEEQKVVLKSYPTSIFVQVDAPCNIDCLFCSRPEVYPYFNLEEFRAKYEKKLLPALQRVERINITGSGELLLLPEAKKNLDYFNQFNFAEKMFATNGSSLTPKMVDHIIESNNRYLIHISMHCCDPLTHKKMTRANTYAAVMQNVNYAMKAKKQTNKLRINFIFVATTENIDKLPDYVKFAADKGADAVVVYYNFVYRLDQKYLSTYFCKDKTNQIFDEAEKLAKELDVNLQLPQRYKQKEYLCEQKCREAWTQLMINPSGDVITCDAAGDLRETILDKKDFMDLWNGKYFVEIRKKLLKGNSACSNFCIRANQASINDFKSHFITRGKSKEEIDKFMENVEEDNNVYINKIMENNNNYDKKQNALIGLYIMQGWQYVKENDEDKIKEICELLKTLYDTATPNDKVNISIYLARVNIDFKNYQIAKDCLLKAIVIEKNNPGLYKLMAMAEYYLKEYKKSKILFFRSLKLAKKINNDFEVSDIYFEMSSYYVMYYVLCNKQNVTENVHINTMIKLLKKSIKYNSENIASVNRLEKIKKEYKL
jgi:MoaA/NifB/PqqE/SkfB family radical SAM enzyme